MKSRLPKLGRGRPSKRTRRAMRIRKRLQKKITDLFENRYLFVQHALTGPERKTLHRITRGLGSLSTVREIMDQVYRLFDRRCRTETALGKRSELRRRVGRFKSLRTSLQKLFSPNFGKGPDLPGRQTSGSDLECGGASQSPLQQDAKDRVPGADPTLDRGSNCNGHAARRSDRGSRTDNFCASLE